MTKLLTVADALLYVTLLLFTATKIEALRVSDPNKVSKAIFLLLMKYMGATKFAFF